MNDAGRVGQGAVGNDATYLGGLILRPLSRFSRNSLRCRRERRPWSGVRPWLVKGGPSQRHTPAPYPGRPALTEYMAFSSSRALACLMASASSLSFRSILQRNEGHEGEGGRHMHSHCRR